MTDVIISFDSEDYLTPQAADAELWWAQALGDRGLRGCFQLVGEFVRSLVRSGRSDVIAALGRHEIDFHTDFHSRPPSHPEAVEHLGLADGIAQILRREAPGLATLAETFATWPVSYCSPGDSWTPATLFAMARMGLRVFCNDRLLPFQRSPYWYCGLLATTYDLDFQRHYEDDAFEEGAFERAFDDLVASTADDGVVVLFTHPTRLVTAAFWDEIFAQGRCPPPAEWIPAPLRSAEEVTRIMDRCRRWLDWLAKRQDLRFIDFATLYRERAASRRGIDDLLRERSLAPGSEDGLVGGGSGSFMPPSVFDAMAYRWLPYREGFTGGRVIQQARELAWTASLAPVNRAGSPSPNLRR